MSFYTLPYDPKASEFGDRKLTVVINGTKKTLTYREAFDDREIRKKSLEFCRIRTFSVLSVPIEFTQYVLCNLAISERGCRHFFRKLNPGVNRCLKGVTGCSLRIERRLVHSSSTRVYAPSGFRGVFVRLFFKKVINNLKNEDGRYEYSENFATIFPFPVLDSVPNEYDIAVKNILDDGFYVEIQRFLDDHFETADARLMVPLFLANIHHFRATRFSKEGLLARVLGDMRNDYLSTFPRLNDRGIEWFEGFYIHYKNVRRIFDGVEIPMDTIYKRNYFETLPESNFVDLYELLDPLIYACRREQYIERFEKYIFFFVHALRSLEKSPNPVFFIDDVLFQCLKCLRRFKTCREDLTVISDIAKIALVHLRTKPHNDDHPDDTDTYQIEGKILQGIQDYAKSIPNVEMAELDVSYVTDYLHGWMLLRNDHSCYEMSYSRKKLNKMDDFLDRILCSVLAPDDRPIRSIVIYNSYMGEENTLTMPHNIESIRNFVRYMNKYDFKNHPQAESSDEFLTKDLERFFDHLTIA